MTKTELAELWRKTAAQLRLEGSDYHYFETLEECADELDALPVPAPSIAPVTGDRLLASLACHIDHDEPPGLAARQLANDLLELLDGLTVFQTVMLSAHVLELTEKFKPGQPGEVTST